MLQVCILSAQQKPVVILISFDGFRSDYIDKLSLPHFKQFRDSGTHAAWLTPSFPSLTFPNHYTLVTGLAPGHHGLVDNQFYHPTLSSEYAMGKREKVRHAGFYGGTPLWTLARQHGMKSASCFWVGSEVDDSTRRPDYFLYYNGKMPNTSRVDQVVKWLQLPEAERPQFITLYFSSPDHESHEHGPFGDSTVLAIQNMDSILGYFMNSLSKVNLPINTIIVSDHGMREMTHQASTYMMYEPWLSGLDTGFKVVGGSCVLHFYSTNTAIIDSIHRRGKLSGGHFISYKKSDIPKHWHYTHEAAGDLIWVANTGFAFRRGRQMPKNEDGAHFGVHGFDPYIDPEMRALCMAKGPQIKVGKKMEAMSNTEVYGLVCQLLGMKPGKYDGKMKTTKAWLK